MIALIVAVDDNNGIGKDNTLPWQLPQDMAYFKSTTIGESNNAVIMGRKTWDSIPDKYRPLKNRFNIIISRQDSLDLPDNCSHAKSLEEALKLSDKYDNTFIIGGAQLYESAISHKDLSTLFITYIAQSFDCDTTFPQIPTQFKPVYESNYHLNKDGITYCFRRYTK